MAAGAGTATPAAGQAGRRQGYSFPSARRLLRRRSIASVILTKSDQRRQPGFDRAGYRGRNQVERSVGRLKQFRRVATRYDKRAINYLAWVILAAITIWLRPFADTP
jgi:transposase